MTPAAEALATTKLVTLANTAAADGDHLAAALACVAAGLRDCMEPEERAALAASGHARIGRPGALRILAAKLAEGA